MFSPHLVCCFAAIGNEESPRIYLPRLRGSCAHRIGAEKPSFGKSCLRAEIPRVSRGNWSSKQAAGSGSCDRPPISSFPYDLRRTLLARSQLVGVAVIRSR
jgi:hypothetical protein